MNAPAGRRALYLTPAGTYDRSAIMAAAWRIARTAAARYRTTPRAEFGACLKREWGRAQHERSYAVWCAEQDADAARKAALPARERDIENARFALIIAEHADSFTAANNAAVAAARVRLHSLQHAA